MSLAAGTLAIKRLQILQHPKETTLTWIMERLGKGVISPILLDEARESALGFCHPFSGEPSFDDPHSLIYGNSLLFGMREDKKRVPATTMKLQLRSALDALGQGKMDAQGKERRMGKKSKEMVKERIKDELLRSTLPSIRLVEVLWNLDNNQIWINSTSKAVIENFEKLFNEYFSLPFVYVNSGTAGLNFESIQLGLTVSLTEMMDVVPMGMIPTEQERRFGATALDSQVKNFEKVNDVF